MDFLFNKYVPISTEERIIIPPEGKTWINGFASKYSTKYQYEFLSKYIKENDYKDFIEYINTAIDDYWPCPTCFCFGYLFCLCSVGKILMHFIIGLSFVSIFIIGSILIIGSISCLLYIY